MTRKKYFIKKARALRKHVKVSLPISKALVKALDKGDTFGFYDALRKYGLDFKADYVYEHCSCCGDHARGYVHVLKDGKKIGSLPVDIHIYIPMEI